MLYIYVYYCATPVQYDGLTRYLVQILLCRVALPVPVVSYNSTRALVLPGSATREYRTYGSARVGNKLRPGSRKPPGVLVYFVWTSAPLEADSVPRRVFYDNFTTMQGRKRKLPRSPDGEPDGSFLLDPRSASAAAAAADGAGAGAAAAGMQHMDPRHIRVVPRSQVRVLHMDPRLVAASAAVGLGQLRSESLGGGGVGGSRRPTGLYVSTQQTGSGSGESKKTRTPEGPESKSDDEREDEEEEGGRKRSRSFEVCINAPRAETDSFLNTASNNPLKTGKLRRNSHEWHGFASQDSGRMN